MNYSVHPDAEKELEEIEEHYDNIHDELGDQFRDEIRAAISQILKFPNSFLPLSQVVRRCRLSSFGTALFIESSLTRFGYWQ
jgi:plasmid stabilization system protein ParE